jgi:hypothetical protein
MTRPCGNAATWSYVAHNQIVMADVIAPLNELHRRKAMNALYPGFHLMIAWAAMTTVAALVYFGPAAQVFGN